MLIIPEPAIHSLMVAIVETSHRIVDQDGQRVTHGTIDDLKLRMAALNAVNTALGDIVWPGDRKIQRPKPLQQLGPFGE